MHKLRIDFIQFCRDYVIFGYYLQVYFTGTIILEDEQVDSGFVDSRAHYEFRKYPYWDAEVSTPWHRCWKRT